MICHFTDTTCKYRECGLWDEKVQDCHFVLLVNKLLGNGDKPIEDLTLQERNVLSLIAQGYSNEPIS